MAIPVPLYGLNDKGMRVLLQYDKDRPNPILDTRPLGGGAAVGNRTAYTSPITASIPDNTTPVNQLVSYGQILTKVNQGLPLTDEERTSFYNSNPDYALSQGVTAPSYFPDLSPSSFPSFLTRGGTQGTTTSPSLSIDPMVSVEQILKNFKQAETVAREPVDSTVQQLIAPQLPGIRKDIERLTGQTIANTISDAGRRGIIGSSTLEGALTREIPATAADALARAEVDLIAKALPVAIQDRAQRAALALDVAKSTVGLRQLFTSEQLEVLNFNQREKLAQLDANLKITLTQIDQQFQAKLKQAEFAFTAAQNDQDRIEAKRQFDRLEAERQKAKEDNFFGALTALVGAGIGFAIPGGTAATALIGMGIGSTVGSLAKGGGDTSSAQTALLLSSLAAGKGGGTTKTPVTSVSTPNVAGSGDIILSRGSGRTAGTWQSPYTLP